jgi:hypothetical protein
MLFVQDVPFVLAELMMMLVTFLLVVAVVPLIVAVVAESAVRKMCSSKPWR